MSEHMADMVAYVMGEDESELGKTKAELAYALHCLEREIAIAHHTQERNQALVKALVKVRSYNIDIDAGRINYRPKDHIQVIDEVLGVVGRAPE